MHLTANFAYFRWHGKEKKSGLITIFKREIRQLGSENSGNKQKEQKIYGFFNNHSNGDPPENCLQLLEKLGLLSETQKKAKDKSKIKQGGVGHFFLANSFFSRNGK